MDRKQEVQVNLIRGMNEDCYRLADDMEVQSLKIQGRLHFEKSVTDPTKKGKKYFCSYYIQA
jgi:hypothetical protein